MALSATVGLPFFSLNSFDWAGKGAPQIFPAGADHPERYPLTPDVQQPALNDGSKSSKAVDLERQLDREHRTKAAESVLNDVGTGLRREEAFLVFGVTRRTLSPQSSNTSSSCFRLSLFDFVVCTGRFPGASQEAIVSVLSNLQDLCKEDPSLEAALREAPIVTDGGGEPAQISDLFDPAVDELPGLLGPEAFPADVFCTSAVSPMYLSLSVPV